VNITHQVRRGVALAVATVALTVGATGVVDAEDSTSEPATSAVASPEPADAPPATDPPIDPIAPTTSTTVAPEPADPSVQATPPPEDTAPPAQDAPPPPSSPPGDDLAPTTSTTVVPEPADPTTTTTPDPVSSVVPEPPADPPGPDSSALKLVPALVPTAPVSASATPANGSVKLTWVAPSNNGGAAIDTYQVQRKTSSAGPWTNLASVSGLSYTAGGLTNGTTYHFRVRAHNLAGWGPFSTVVSAVPRTVPTAPQTPTAQPGNASVQLSWTAPSSNGGAAIVNYHVQRATGSAGPWATIDFPTTASDTAIYLVNGTKYYFRVRAQNAAGWGPWSTTVSATPRTAPTAPSSPKATPGSNYVKLSWSPPTSNGGASIDTYAVQRSTSSSGPWTNIGFPAGTSYTATGLANGTKYYFRIKAHNAGGWGAPSMLVSATPQLAKPPAPRSLTVTVGNGSVTLSWLPPVNANGVVVVDKYAVLRAIDDDPFYNAGYPTTTSVKITGLTNGKTYKFYVIAHNAAGWGSQSNVVTVTPGTVPGAPLACSASQVDSGSTFVHVVWVPPLHNGGLPIEHYRIRLYKNGALVATLAFTNGNTYFVDREVSFGFGTYEVRVSAGNDKGYGPACIDAVTLVPLFN
jgi:fibronectin type 3 domain-containing protein